MTEVNVPQPIIDLVMKVFENNPAYKVVDWDFDRVYIEKDSEEYTIRTWDITETFISWTLFKSIELADGSGYGEEVSDGTFYYTV
ncbi:hypothetical protein [Lysinibacillus boronitolerans]|uniref:hypothetical protein n=1 Tax=Lysinibacillus boronitolerans TaxID=309788 RepID=UPI002897DE13|nr:hypothetical protein [Lysinibacillus boronitolerans]